MASAEELAASTDYELRALEVPALHFAAVHLVAEVALFIPVLEIRGGRTEIKTMRPYSAKELADALQPLAQQALVEWPE